MDIPNLTNDLDIDNISCECHSNNDRPAESSLGDSICRQSISSVREIIKKYEPTDNNNNNNINNNSNNNNINYGQEIKRGSYGSLRSLKSARSINNTQQQQQQQPINCAAPRSSRELINQHIVYNDDQNGSNNNGGKNNDNISRKHNYNNKLNNNNDDLLTSYQGFQTNGVLLKKCDLEYIRGKDVDDKLNNNSNSSEFKCNLTNNSDISYQSKTTIAKTSNGVRIITDIFFDTNTEYNWQGSRIETDIPPSKILKDFQEKNHPKVN